MSARGTAPAPQRDEGLDRLEDFIATLVSTQAIFERTADAVEALDDELEAATDQAEEAMEALGESVREFTDEALAEAIANRKEIIHDLVWLGIVPIIAAAHSGGVAYSSGYAFATFLATHIERDLNRYADLVVAAYEEMPAVQREAEAALGEAREKLLEALQALIASLGARMEEVQEEGIRVTFDPLHGPEEALEGAFDEATGTSSEEENGWTQWSHELQRLIAVALESLEEEANAAVSALLGPSGAEIVHELMASIDRVGGALDEAIGRLGLSARFSASAGSDGAGGYASGGAGFTAGGMSLDFNVAIHSGALGLLAPLSDLMAPLTTAAGIVGKIRQLLDALNPF